MKRKLRSSQRIYSFLIRDRTEDRKGRHGLRKGHAQSPQAAALCSRKPVYPGLPEFPCPGLCRLLNASRQPLCLANESGHPRPMLASMNGVVPFSRVATYKSASRSMNDWFRNQVESPSMEMGKARVDGFRRRTLLGVWGVFLSGHAV
jgi:hypothetical protein